MSQAERRARRGAKVVLRLYREMDDRAFAIARSRGMTCREGCAHCCKLPASAMLEEMVPAVLALSARTDWPRLRPQLEHAIAANLRAHAGVDLGNDRERAAFFNRQIPCVFLGADQRCSIYEHRPSVCRYHFAMSPPEHCSVDAPAGAEVSRLDTRSLEDYVIAAVVETTGRVTGGPLAAAFVHAARILGVELDVPEDALRGVMWIDAPAEVVGS